LRAAPWLAGAVTLLVGLLVMDTFFPVGLVHDDGMYVILAKSLATGHGYTWLHVPGTPPATHFPPGYPALLALLWKLNPVFPGNVALFKLVNAILLAIAAAGTTVFARRRLGFPPLPAALLAIAGAIGIPMLVLSTMVMSEPFFLALLFPALLLAERVVDGERRTHVLVALGLYAGVATLVRSHGIALVGSIGLVLLLERRVRDAIVCGLSALVVMAPWQLWVRAHEGFVPAAMRGNYESYTGWLARGLHEEGAGLLLRTLRRTTNELAGMFATFSAYQMPAAIRVATLVALALLAAVGLYRMWRVARITAVFLPLYTLIVILWPFTSARFIWGIWPLVVLLPAFGAAQLWAWRPSGAGVRWRRVALALCAAFMAVNYVRVNVNGYRRHWWSSISRAGAGNVRGLVMWVRANTRPQDVVMSNAEPLVYLYADRASLPATAFTVQDYFRSATARESADALRDILSAYRVDVVAVVAADSLAAGALAMAGARPPELTLRDTFPNGMAFTPIRK
jgi:hypothetical protein